MDFNPYLTQSEPDQRGDIEKPGVANNIAWQTRAAPPSAYEDALGDALEQAFAADAADLPALVTKLNQLGSRDPAGQPWTEASFQREIKRLAGG
jgi:hypothetical protein